jgi:hypothetical protein
MAAARPLWPGEPSPQLFRSPQAGNHRDPQQIIVGSAAVGCDVPQRPSKLLAIGFEVALVLDRLPLGAFERDQPSLAIEALELARAALSMPDVSQPFGQIDRVVNAAVHPHAPERIVDVCRIANQERASVEARDSSLSVAPASNTVTGTPRWTRLAAATRPTGPAPAMKTRSCIRHDRYSIFSMWALVMMSRYLMISAW